MEKMQYQSAPPKGKKKFEKSRKASMFEENLIHLIRFESIGTAREGAELKSNVERSCLLRSLLIPT